jgi:hypothetical protein
VIRAADVQAIVNELDIYIAPLINPDGRDYSFAKDNFWRKNLTPAPAPLKAMGVDLNRNLEIAWDYEKYYKNLPNGVIAMSKKWSDYETFIGPSAASEIETKNLQDLLKLVILRGGPQTTAYLDVHSFARKILYPWGMEDNQPLHPKMNFHNPDWDRTGRFKGRDGVGGTYGEFNYQTFVDKEKQIADLMRDEILQTGDPPHIDRSTYEPEQSIALGYLTTGAADDYAYSQQFLSTDHPEALVFTLECGSAKDGEAGFHPNFLTKYPKIEREVHAAAFRLLRFVAP